MAADNPWGAAPSSGAESTASAAHSASHAADTATALSAGNAADQPFSLWQPFNHVRIPLDKWVEQFIEWVVQHFRGFFTTIKTPIDWTLTSIESTLQAVPPLLLIAVLALLAWQLSGKKLAIGTLIGMLFIGFIGAWPETVTTLSLVITAVLFCMLIGIPTGIAMARSEKIAKVLRPLLDAMQTTPAFVYLVPIVMLFGIGNVPGVVVTIIFAVPPVIRLTNLGIRQVPEDLIEAAHSFGADAKQMLLKVQLPLALPTIMAGVNQTLMLSLSMVVIASMISVGGLGLMVLRGIGRLDIGLASVGGLGIVIMAIVLDRMTQSLGQSSRSRAERWYRTGPVGLLTRPFTQKNRP